MGTKKEKINGSLLVGGDINTKSEWDDLLLDAGRALGINIDEDKIGWIILSFYD